MFRPAAIFSMLALPLLLAGNAAAQGCDTRSTLAGALAKPHAPCRESDRRPLQPQSGRQTPAQQGERGVFRHGNTTLRVGGSVSTEMSVGGR
jgi:hypothetical protein